MDRRHKLFGISVSIHFFRLNNGPRFRIGRRPLVIKRSFLKKRSRYRYFQSRHLPLMQIGTIGKYEGSDGYFYAIRVGRQLESARFFFFRNQSLRTVDPYPKFHLLPHPKHPKTANRPHHLCIENQAISWGGRQWAKHRHPISTKKPYQNDGCHQLSHDRSR